MKKINIHRPSRWFFLCGHSPFVPRWRVERVSSLSAAWLTLFFGKYSAIVQRQLLAKLIFFELVLDIFCYPCRILTDSIYIVSSAPEFSVSVLILQLTKLFIEHRAAFAFQVPHETRDGKFWRDLYEHMNMVGACFSLHNIHSFPFVEFPQNFPNKYLFVFIEHKAPIFRRKN